jgi:hypothetical protein
MSTKWIYCQTQYDTKAEADAAVLAQKSRLDNNPADWVVVKKLTGNASDGWVLPPQTLTDSEINNLDETEHYSVASIVGGENCLGLTASEVTAKVAELRTEFAQHIMVDTIFTRSTTDQADMAPYV